MSSNVKAEKKELRRSIKDILGKLEQSDVEQQSRSVTQKVLQLPEYRNATSISIFLSMPGREISTTDIVLHALHQGKQVFVPYIHSDKEAPKSKTMDMLRLRDESDLRSLKPDAWGIPSLSAESIESRDNALGGQGISATNHTDPKSVQLDLIFMPGMAFDISNNRLGHGKGFYDRYLSRCRETLGSGNSTREFPKLVGLGLREQRLPQQQSVPTSEDDWKIDRLVIPD